MLKKIIIITGLILSSASICFGAVTVYSLGQVANVQATLKDGGSLAANTTYYVRVEGVRYIGFVNTGDLRYPNIYSQPSAEIYFTTTDAQKAVDLTWDALTNANSYRIYMTTVSGNYYGVNKAFQNNTSTGPTTNSYEITTIPAYSVGAYWNRSWLINPTKGLPHGIPIDTGRLGIRLSGTCTLQDIKTAVDAAGFSSYCYYDNYIFALKGIIYSMSGDGTTTFAPRNANIYLIEGDIANNNASASFSFGDYDSTELVAYNKCAINILGYSNILNYGTAGAMNFYCDFKGSFGASPTYFTGNGYLLNRYSGMVHSGGSIEGFSVFVLGVGAATVNGLTLRNTTSLETYVDIENVKIYNGRLLLTNPISCKNVSVYQNPALSGYADCDIQLTDSSSSPGRVYSLHSFNCLRTNNQACIYWYLQNGGSPIVKFYNEVVLTVVDAGGSPIAGATVTVVDKNGTQQFSAATNASGQFDAQQYVLSQSAVPSAGTGTGTTWTTYSPFTVSIVNSGYRTYEGKVTINSSVNWSTIMSQGDTVIYDSTIYDSAIY